MNPKDRQIIRNKAQSAIEYTVLIAIIAAALIAMQVYIKRSIQGRIRGYAEQLSEGSSYSPAAVNATSTITRSVEEETHSYTEGEDEEKKSITETHADIYQTTDRQEQTLSLGGN